MRPRLDGTRGEHEAIVETSVFDRAQAVLADPKRRGVEGRLIVDGGTTSTQTPDQPLVDLLGRVHAYLKALTEGRAANAVEVAALYGVHRAEVSRILLLAFLTPAITEAILNGRQPIELSARNLSREIDLPVAWDEQTARLGM